MPYTTKQHQAILACLERRREQPLSAADLAAELRQEGQPVSLATIYRQLERLEAAGRIHKVTTEEGAYFQYCGSSGERGCLLLKCNACGRIAHLDCSHLAPLYAHLRQEHRFVVDNRRTLLTGLCAACAEKEDGHGTE